jgi:hypothetical protein
MRRKNVGRALREFLPALCLRTRGRRASRCRNRWIGRARPSSRRRCRRACLLQWRRRRKRRRKRRWGSQHRRVRQSLRLHLPHHNLVRPPGPTLPPTQSSTKSTASSCAPLPSRWMGAHRATSPAPWNGRLARPTACARGHLTTSSPRPSRLLWASERPPAYGFQRYVSPLA